MINQWWEKDKNFDKIFWRNKTRTAEWRRRSRRLLRQLRAISWSRKQQARWRPTRATRPTCKFFLQIYLNYVFILQRKNSLPTTAQPTVLPIRCSRALTTTNRVATAAPMRRSSTMAAAPVRHPWALTAWRWGTAAASPSSCTRSCYISTYTTIIFLLCLAVNYYSYDYRYTTIAYPCHLCPAISHYPNNSHYNRLSLLFY